MDNVIYGTDFKAKAEKERGETESVKLPVPVAIWVETDFAEAYEDAAMRCLTTPFVAPTEDSA